MRMNGWDLYEFILKEIFSFIFLSADGRDFGLRERGEG